jgi:tRNA nucleotidyltransferase (CCA-adding enzyme)
MDDITRRLLSARVVSRKFIYDCLKPLPNEVILYLMAKARSNDIKRYISLYFTQLKYVRPHVTGKDLEDLGYVPGPLFKQILDDVLEHKFMGELRTKADEMSFVLTRFPKE